MSDEINTARHESWSCVIPGTPRQKGNSKTARYSRKSGRAWVVPDARTVEAQNSAKALAWAQRPAELLSSNVEPQALRADVVFVFPIPKSRRKEVRHKDGTVTPALKPGDPHIQDPDRGNCLKMAEDVLEDIVYADDCVVCAGEVSKVWGSEGETRIVVRRLVVGTQLNNATLSPPTALRR